MCLWTWRYNTRKCIRRGVLHWWHWANFEGMKLCLAWTPIFHSNCKFTFIVFMRATCLTHHFFPSHLSPFLSFLPHLVPSISFLFSPLSSTSLLNGPFPVHKAQCQTCPHWDKYSPTAVETPKAPSMHKDTSHGSEWHHALHSWRYLATYLHIFCIYLHFGMQFSCLCLTIDFQTLDYLHCKKWCAEVAHLGVLFECLPK